MTCTQILNERKQSQSSLHTVPLDCLTHEQLSSLQRARPEEYAESFFNHHLRVAAALGMTWLQTLTYVAEKRVENGNTVIAALLTQMAH